MGRQIRAAGLAVCGGNFGQDSLAARSCDKLNIFALMSNFNRRAPEARRLSGPNYPVGQVIWLRARTRPIDKCGRRLIAHCSPAELAGGQIDMSAAVVVVGGGGASGASGAPVSQPVVGPSCAWLQWGRRATGRKEGRKEGRKANRKEAATNQLL